MKKRFLFVLALISVLSLSGCKEKSENNATQLSSPQQVTVQTSGDKSLIIFDEVKDADYYDIYINDICVTVKSNGTGTVRFDASKIITLPQKYVIKVKALGDNNFDSEFTKEYEYNHVNVLEAPVISIDGTTLNWDKIPNAEFYDVLVTSSNPVVETTHRFPTNSFNFSNILANKGEYTFKVRAINESGQYESSIYSNQVKYTHIIKLITPYNLIVNRDSNSDETLISFISSDNVDNFTISLNGVNYSLPPKDMDKYICADDIENLYTLKLTTFVRDKSVKFDCSNLLNVAIKANTTNEYLTSSDFSKSVTCKYVSVLEAPNFTIHPTQTSCKLTIQPLDSEYISSFAIYLDNKKYKTISSDILQLDLPLSEIGNAGISIQAISNNINCYSSNLSEAIYINESLQKLNNFSLNYADGILSWDLVENATKYYVQIKNSEFRYVDLITDTQFNVKDVCANGKYEISVTAMADGYRQCTSEVYDIFVNSVLNTPTNVTMSNQGNNTYLSFDEITNADGYVIYLNDTKVNQIFTSSPINLNQYISSGNSYSVKIKAIRILNTGIVESVESTEQEVQSIKTLTSPTLSISKQDDKYYLNINIEDSEKDLGSSYEIWINYQSIGNLPFKDTQLDITSYFTNAGRYNFMVKCKAIDSPYLKDSNMASLTYNCVKQLDVVSNIQVSKISEQNKYILTFNEQTLAAKYLVKIVKAGDENYNVEFELNRGVADISQYIVANGVYRVYVKALAIEGGFYTDSPTSGNPYRLTKGETLGIPENIKVEKNVSTTSNGEVYVSWDSVNNALGYQVYIYYTANNMQVLKKSMFVPQSISPKVNIGSGENLCLNKEGSYTIQIKAVGDDEVYETGQMSLTPYVYTMENKFDFKRNTVYMYGNTYNYYIENANQLANLLWYHYLYNQDVWKYGTLEYNVKVYCQLKLDNLANSISDSVGAQVQSATTNVEKMGIIAKALLEQYPEIANYTLGKSGQTFCLNEEKNVYIFKFNDNLNSDKLQSIPTDRKVYKDKVDTVDVFDQRTDAYVFSIDKKATIDVTTTEQLFMALQYNKKPNFVGDCTVAKAVYQNARFVLRQICSDNMTEYEKTLRIYEFLTKRITLNDMDLGDWAEEIALGDEEPTLRGNLKDYYLEGIFYNMSSNNEPSNNGLFTSIDEFVGRTATSEGLSKAFVVLCAIEGIDAIKVNGKINIDENTTVNYSWNKVYIDIEDDGAEGKKWYAIDLTAAIKNLINIKESGSTTSYQVALHKYFLITDSQMGIQATNWHKRLGSNEDYVANTEFNYYITERFYCEFNSVKAEGSFKIGEDGEVEDLLIYGMLKANKKHRIVIDVDAHAYISAITGGATDENSLIQVKNKINSMYESAQTALGGEYNCNLNILIIDAQYIVFVLEGQSYIQ